MKRILALGVGMAVSAVAVAGEPVSVHPPASSLSRPLPSVVQDAATAPAPAPSLVSTPTRWSASDVVQPSGGTIPTHYGPTSFAPTAAAGCDTCGPTGGCRPHFNLLSPGLLPRASGCGPRGSLLDRLKAWFGFQPCPSGVPHCAPRPFYAPMRWYFPYSNYGINACGTGGCATGHCATGHCATPAHGRITERGRLFAGRENCDVSIPYTPATADCGGGTCRPRVLYVPLGGSACNGGECGDGRAARPGLFRRLMARLGLCDGDSGYGCSSGNCPPPAPSPVHYAAPCQTPPAPQPGSGMTYPPAVQPSVVPAQPMTPPAPARTDGKVNTRLASPTQAFTNP